MSESISTWTGRIIDNNIALADYLGGADNTAVYRTTFSGQKAAIKLTAADPSSAEAHLKHFADAAKLSHPNLLRILKTGRTQLEGSEYIYVVTEFADENLSQVLPDRTLTPQETRDVLAAVLDALSYLHQQGFAHADLKPANIMASNDQLKLSVDAIARLGEPLGREPGPHDAPEAPKRVSSASDIYALGVTIVEVLTQKLPPQPASEKAGPAVPETVPAPFREIAQHCLLHTPELRWSIPEISNKLNLAVANTGRPSVVDASRPQSAAPSPTVVDAGRPVVVDGSRPQPASRRPFILLGIIAIIVAAIIAIPRLSHHEQPATITPTQTTTEQSAPHVTSEPTPESPKTEETVPPPSQQQTAETPVPARAPAASTTTTAAKQITDEPVEANDDSSVETTGAAPGVVHQVMPAVIPQARKSITGKVRVKLRVDVDPSGNVTDSKFISAGPSKYFARVAMQAAQQWKFVPTSTEARAWTIEFDFRRSGTQVHSSPQP